MTDLRDIEVKTINGESQSLADYADRALLIVNVASKCGFTPQYGGLEALYRQFKDRGFAVLGFPCDQFGHQEPGSEEEIRDFCSSKYEVSFPMFSKIEVNGPGTHPPVPIPEKRRPWGIWHRENQMELHEISA